MRHVSRHSQRSLLSPLLSTPHALFAALGGWAAACFAAAFEAIGAGIDSARFGLVLAPAGSAAQLSPAPMLR